jgi:hypothetical protein
MVHFINLAQRWRFRNPVEAAKIAARETMLNMELNEKKVLGMD